LRRFFEVDRHGVAIAALHRLARRGAVDPARVTKAIARYGVEAGAEPPWER
jgi:pyruvate dehydrogenase E1 component